MPKPCKRLNQLQIGAKSLQPFKGLTWNVEEAIEACDYMLGKLTLGKAVVGEITVIKTEFPRVLSVLSQLGINVRIDE